MEKRNTRFTNRKSGGDRNFTLYLYFLIYKGGQGKKQAAGKSSSPSAQAQNSPAEKYRTSLQLSWQHNVAQLSECRCKMQDCTFLHLVGSSDLAYKIETVSELCTKKRDVSLGGDVTARLNKQTDSSTDILQHF